MKSPIDVIIDKCIIRGDCVDEMCIQVAQALQAEGSPTTGVREMIERRLEDENLERVMNIMSRRWLWQPRDTPLSCDPSHETYWCM